MSSFARVYIVNFMLYRNLNDFILQPVCEKFGGSKKSFSWLGQKVNKIWATQESHSHESLNAKNHHHHHVNGTNIKCRQKYNYNYEIYVAPDSTQALFILLTNPRHSWAALVLHKSTLSSKLRHDIVEEVQYAGGAAPSPRVRLQTSTASNDNAREVF